MKNLIKISTLVGALICVSSVSLAPPAEAHDLYRNDRAECRRIERCDNPVAYRGIGLAQGVVRDVLWHLGL